MSSSTKGLKGNAQAGYREHIEGWTCDYTKETGWSHGDYTGPGVMWSYVVSRRGALLGAGIARTRTAARAAARAVVMERETRGLEVTWTGALRGNGAFFVFAEGRWGWRLDDGGRWGSAPTLAEARKAAREAQQDA
jgi:hypothetical protein